MEQEPAILKQEICVGMVFIFVYLNAHAVIINIYIQIHVWKSLSRKVVRI